MDDGHGFDRAQNVYKRDDAVVQWTKPRCAGSGLLAVSQQLGQVRRASVVIVILDPHSLQRLSRVRLLILDGRLTSTGIASGQVKVYSTETALTGGHRNGVVRGGGWTHLNGFCDGDDLCATVRLVGLAADDDDDDAPSIDLTNRAWRARFFIFILCIFIRSSGRFHFGGVQPLSNMTNTVTSDRTKVYRRRERRRRPLLATRAQLLVLIKTIWPAVIADIIFHFFFLQ